MRLMDSFFYCYQSILQAYFIYRLTVLFPFFKRVAVGVCCVEDCKIHSDQRFGVHIGWQRTCDYHHLNRKRNEHNLSDGETFTEAITSIITINLCSTPYSILLKSSNSIWNQSITPVTKFYLKSIQINIRKRTETPNPDSELRFYECDAVKKQLVILFYCFYANGNGAINWYQCLILIE